MPHASVAPVQVAVPLAGAGQGVQAAAVVPQDEMLLFCAHTIPQR
jgi:hypothetical protein